MLIHTEFTMTWLNGLVTCLLIEGRGLWWKLDHLGGGLRLVEFCMDLHFELHVNNLDINIDQFVSKFIDDIKIGSVANRAEK